MEKLSHVINYHIEELKVIEGLSQRTKNVCINSSIDTLYKILYYYIEHQSFINIRNCGLNTEKELVKLSKKYLTNLDNIDKKKFEITSKAMREFEDFRRFCFINFKLSSDVACSYQSEFIKGEFPAFKFIEDLVNCILDNCEKYIFRSNFYFYSNSRKEKLQALGDRFSFTRERARQVTEVVLSKFEKAILLLSEYYPKIGKKTPYRGLVQKIFLDIDTQFENRINKREGTSFTNKFYWFILKTFFYRTKSGFQAFDKKLSHYFLVDIEYLRIFDFAKFYADAENRLNERTPESYSMDFSKYLEPFLIGTNTISEELKTICKHILSVNFDLKFHNDEVVFPRNTLVKISEVIVSILKNAGHPMTIAEIYFKLKKNHPSKVPSNVESLRSSIFNHNEIVAIGKTSTYALTSWTHVQTGTIKEIIRSYLQQFDTPKRISDIRAHVNQFRKTTEKNILSNLKLDKSGIFAFYKNSCIGLKVAGTPITPPQKVVKLVKNIELEAVLEGVADDKKEESISTKTQLSLF